MAKDGRGDVWCEAALRRLSSAGYVISRDVRYGGQAFRAVAHCSELRLTKFGNSETFFVFAEMEPPSIAAVREFSGRAFRYAKASRKVPLPCGLCESVWCFAVAMVAALDEGTGEAVRNEVPRKHWSAAEIPVIYDSGPGRLCYFEKTPMWGAAYYGGFRSQIRQFLGATRDA